MPEVEKIATGTTLYYPYIHPRKIDHLKATLIYWDRVRRIVPRPVSEGGYVYDDDEDARILADHDLLVATRPDPYEEGAAKRFFEHIESNSTRFRIDVEAARELAQRDRGIHVEKIGYGALERLKELGLAHRFGEWVSMRDEVGAFYMFCLASEMSSRMSAPLFSDSKENAPLGQSLLFEPDFHATTDVTDVLLRVGITLPAPEKLRHVSTRTFAEFATKRSVERQMFREAVEGIVEQVRSTSDSNVIDDYLDSQKKKITEAVKNLRSALDELHVGGVNSIAQITVPAGAALAIAALPISVTAAAILGATGLAIAAIACLAETRGKLREARTSTPYHYLLSVEKEFNIATMQPREGNKE